MCNKKEQNKVLKTNNPTPPLVSYPMKRTSINEVREFSDLNDLKLIVKDKRVAKRADAKKERRNRHYVKLLIKSQLNNYDLES
jgi:hypothetical protein